jgi:hypothetical protein
MNMKKLIESMDRIEECGMTEMPAMPASLPAPEQHEGNPVTVNVNMNASGKEHVADLLDMMKNAGLGSAEPVSAKTLSPRMDMERLSAMMDEPGFDDKEMPLPSDAEADMEEVEDEIEVEGDYANEPDPEYGDMSDAIPDGNDLNRKKKAYAATQDGDNPMAVENIKAALYAALTEKKKTMVKGPDGKMVPDYAADGKGKDDLSKGKKDTKTTEGRGKVMAGRGRGKDKLMAGRGRGKKK